MRGRSVAWVFRIDLEPWCQPSLIIKLSNESLGDPIGQSGPIPQLPDENRLISGECFKTVPTWDVGRPLISLRRPKKVGKCRPRRYFLTEFVLVPSLFCPHYVLLKPLCRPHLADCPITRTPIEIRIWWYILSFQWACYILSSFRYIRLKILRL